VCIRNDQSEPVFYYDHRPYIRDGSQSRPATPDEVKARILAHPSAEHKKRMDDLNYEMAKGIIEQNAKRMAAEDEITHRALAAQHETLAEAGRRFLDGR
jgi:hypothetical protein